MSNKITEVRLLAVPLENDYNHTLYFSNATEQATYFMSKTIRSISESSYQRKERYISFPAHYDEISHCNYVMYRNSAYSQKWYYAFVTKLEYKNDETTWIYIDTDVIQTWLFDYTVKPSFVEREHVDDDTIGIHTVPEALETGDCIVNQKRTLDMTKSNLKIIIGSTVDFNDADFSLWDGEAKKYDIATGGSYNGIFSGVNYFIVTAEQARDLISSLANTGQSDAIVSMFMAPADLIPRYPDGYEVDSTWVTPYEPVFSGAYARNLFWSSLNKDDTRSEPNLKPKSLNGYIPRNNKLLTYPFTYLLMSNNSGGAALYKYELFKNALFPDECNFRIESAVVPGMSVRIIPQNYNGESENNEEGLNLGKFPICSWANDVYTNWLTQNSVNNSVSIVAGAAMTLVGIAGVLAAAPTGGASIVAGSTAVSAIASAGTAVGGAAMVGNTLGQVHAQSFQPPQAQGNLNSGDVTFSSGHLTFTGYQMTIKKEYAKIIDGYFDMYGYRVNQLKTPSKNHRENYWFTKTIDVNIDGAIPMEDMLKIKACYNRGITFWKNPANIGDYSVSNTIV